LQTEKLQNANKKKLQICLQIVCKSLQICLQTLTASMADG